MYFISYIHTGVKPATKADSNRRLATQYYDYIDTARAEEKGIRVKDNYAYNHPKIGSKGNNTTYPDDGEYSDPNSTQRRARPKGRDKNNKISKEHTAPLSEISTVTQNEEPELYGSTKKLDPLVSKSTESLKSLPKGSKNETYAPPLGNLGISTADEPEILETAFVEEGKIDIYSSPQKNPDPASPMKPKSKQKQNKSSKDMLASGKIAKERKTYASPLTNMSVSQTSLSGASMQAATPADDEYVGPVVSPAKHNEGIDLKDNYAYKLTQKKEKLELDSYATPTTTDDYVGPVVPPEHHNEGIDLKDNSAYKTSDVEKSKPVPKKRVQKVKPVLKKSNSDLRTAYS